MKPTQKQFGRCLYGILQLIPVLSSLALNQAPNAAKWMLVGAVLSVSASAQLPPLPTAAPVPKRFKSVSTVKGATLLLSAPLPAPTTNTITLTWNPAPGCFTRIWQTTDLRTWTWLMDAPITQTSLTLPATNAAAMFRMDAYIKCVDDGYWVCAGAVTVHQTSTP